MNGAAEYEGAASRTLVRPQVRRPLAVEYPPDRAKMDSAIGWVAATSGTV